MVGVRVEVDAIRSGRRGNRRALLLLLDLLSLLLLLLYLLLLLLLLSVVLELELLMLGTLLMVMAGTVIAGQVAKRGEAGVVLLGSRSERRWGRIGVLLMLRSVVAVHQAVSVGRDLVGSGVELLRCKGGRLSRHRVGVGAHGLRMLVLVLVLHLDLLVMGLVWVSAGVWLLDLVGLVGVLRVLRDTVLRRVLDLLHSVLVLALDGVLAPTLAHRDWNWHSRALCANSSAGTISSVRDAGRARGALARPLWLGVGFHWRGTDRQTATEVSFYSNTRRRKESKQDGR